VKREVERFDRFASLLELDTARLPQRRRAGSLTPMRLRRELLRYPRSVRESIAARRASNVVCHVRPTAVVCAALEHDGTAWVERRELGRDWRSLDLPRGSVPSFVDWSGDTLWTLVVDEDAQQRSFAAVDLARETWWIGPKCPGDQYDLFGVAAGSERLTAVLTTCNEPGSFRLEAQMISRAIAATAPSVLFDYVPSDHDVWASVAPDGSVASFRLGADALEPFCLDRERRLHEGAKLALLPPSRGPLLRPARGRGLWARRGARLVTSLDGGGSWVCAGELRAGGEFRAPWLRAWRSHATIADVRAGHADLWTVATSGAITEQRLEGDIGGLFEVGDDPPQLWGAPTMWRRGAPEVSILPVTAHAYSGRSWGLVERFELLGSGQHLRVVELGDHFVDLGANPDGASRSQLS
jgi:hypothetical protein